MTDTTILRTLAAQVAELAACPQNIERRQSWIEHNALRSRRPMMLIFPEGAWRELLPESVLACEEATNRSIEWELRRRIYTWQHFQDDSVIEAEWMVGPNLVTTGWGLEPVTQPPDDELGAFRIQPVLNEPEDLNKLRYPDLVYNAADHERRADALHALFGDLLTVKKMGVSHISYHLWAQYLYLRGEQRCMVDLIDAPEFVHETLTFFEEGHHRLLRQMLDLNLLSLNNDNTYHSSGGNGYTDQLPAPGFDPACVRPCDLWASAESQELAGVSPRMHRAFALQYESRLLAPFGLTGYGCCEDLSRKLPDIFELLPNIRRISISPFADVERSAAALRDRAIFSWKPQPAHLVGEFDETAIRAYLRATLELCASYNCYPEIILKDTHTCENRPERFDRWTQIAREEIGL
jgi:hypothetical protein